MASKIGMSYRNEASQGRIDDALTSLVSGLALDIQPLPSVRRDPILQEAVRLEWTADVLEAIGAALTASTVDDADPAQVAAKAKGR